MLHVFSFYTVMHKIRVRVMVFNTTFNNISVILVEETRIYGENHRPVKVTEKLYSVVSVHLTMRPRGIRTHNFSGDRH